MNYLRMPGLVAVAFLLTAQGFAAEKPGKAAAAKAATAKAKAEAEAEKAAAEKAAAEAEAAEKAAVPTDISPEADKLLHTVSDFYKAHKTARCEIKMTLMQEAKGEKNEMEVGASIAVQQPNQCALQLEGLTQGGATFISDGKTMTTYLAPLKQYTELPTAATMDEILQTEEAGMAGLAQMGVLRGLFMSDPYKWMMSGVTVLKMLPSETVDGRECDHIRAEQAEVDWEAWFEKGPRPLLCKFSYSPLKGVLAQVSEEERVEFQDAKLEILLNVSGWKLDEEFPAETFKFKAPDGAKKVEQFTPEMEEGESKDSVAELKGQPAPNFTLDLLGGGQVDLAKHSGKEIVILDFWASWSGPCAGTLASVNEVAAAYKDKGVVYYALNQMEEPGEIKTFLEEQKLAVPVALDKEGKTGRLYQVEGLPHTVIIDQSGTIRGVHVGFDPELMKTLKAELDALLVKK